MGAVKKKPSAVSSKAKKVAKSVPIKAKPSVNSKKNVKKVASMKSKDVKTNKKVAYGRDTLPQKNSGQKLQK